MLYAQPCGGAGGGGSDFAMNVLVANPGEDR
jgi:hypothetical protein